MSLGQLAESYIARKRFESEVLVASLLRALSGSTDGRQVESGPQRVSVEEMLSLMGVSLNGTSG